MAITWRVPVLVLLGIGPLLLRPSPGTAWAWVGLVVVLVIGFLVDIAHRLLDPRLRSNA